MTNLSTISLLPIAVIGTFFFSIIIMMHRLVGNNENGIMSKFLSICSLFASAIVAMKLQSVSAAVPFPQMIALSIIASIVATMSSLQMLPNLHTVSSDHGNATSQSIDQTFESKVLVDDAVIVAKRKAIALQTNNQTNHSHKRTVAVPQSLLDAGRSDLGGTTTQAVKPQQPHGDTPTSTPSGNTTAFPDKSLVSRLEETEELAV